MKIIMIDYFLPNSIYSLELCEKLAESNEVILLCKDNFVVERQYNFKIFPIIHSKSNNKIHGLTLYLKDLKNIWAIVKKNNPNILHIQQVQHIVYEKKLFKILKKYVNKIVFTAHNILSHEIKRGEKKKLNSLYKVFDCIIVHNNMSKEMLQTNSNYRKEVYVIPHGVYNTYMETVKEVNKEKTTFLQFGLIREYKGVDILLKAISLLPAHVKKNTKFIIAGALNKKQYSFDIYNEVKKLGIENCVDLKIGRVKDDEIPNLFNQVDYCVFPYRHIYGSGALLMAYTYTKPVLVSDIPVFIEETNSGKTGLIFCSEDCQSLANKIVELYMKEKQEIKVYKEEIKMLVSEKYNWSNSSILTLKAYEQ